METIVKLIAYGLLPVGLSILFTLLDQKTAFGKLPFWPKQIIIGVLFGGTAILATEFGIPIPGAVINVRDASPVCAGLIFGAPAGVIAGLIGGIERWFCVLWGGGAYTRLACTVSTILAGMIAAVLRKTIFEDKRPHWLYGFLAALTAEVFHMLMVFFTNMNDIRTAFSFVTACSVPMVIANCVAVTLAMIIISLINQEDPTENLKKKKLTSVISVWLLADILAAFLITCFATYAIQTSTTTHDTESRLIKNNSVIAADIQEWVDNQLLDSARSFAAAVDSASVVTNEFLDSLLAENPEYSEFIVIGKDGIISHCTDRTLIGYDMAGQEQSAAFLCLLKGEKAFAQEMQKRGANDEQFKYVGVALKKGGFIQIGVNAANLHKMLDAKIADSATYKNMSDNGRIMVVSSNGTIVLDSDDAAGENISRLGIEIDANQPVNKMFALTVNDTEQQVVYNTVESYNIISMMPESEVFYMRDLTVYLTVFMDIIVFSTLFLIIFLLIKSMVIKNIQDITLTLNRIAHGDLDASVDIKSNAEFVSLSNDLNTTVGTLKQYIREAQDRMKQELEVATVIQASSLPSEFPPFPERTEFDIFATMTPAREVGGDFYDFYFLDEDRLAFLIADVSGKGITGAMFMMKAKAVLKGESEIYDDVEDILAGANDALCEGNEAEMFVTCWMGIMDFSTHTLTWGSAGHNPPVIRRKGGRYEYLAGRPNFVLAGLEGVPYTQHEMEFEPGDEIILYTDGVTEATDVNNELYGDERLLNVLNALGEPNCEEICYKIKEDIDLFVGEAPQFDDMTILSMKIMR